MMGVLFLLFTVVPIAETWGIIELGSRIGAAQTVTYLVAVGALGAWLGKRAGFAVLRDLFAGLSRGEPPADRLVEAGLVLVGAVLLVTPGLLTDLAGILLFVPPVRRWLAPRARHAALRWLTARGVQVGTASAGPRAREQARARERFDHPSVD
jgi:UPF0716 protein FxsA